MNATSFLKCTHVVMWRSQLPSGLERKINHPFAQCHITASHEMMISPNTVNVHQCACKAKQISPTKLALKISCRSDWHRDSSETRIPEPCVLLHDILASCWMQFFPSSQNLPPPSVTSKIIKKIEKIKLDYLTTENREQCLPPFQTVRSFAALYANGCHLPSSSRTAGFTRETAIIISVLTWMKISRLDIIFTTTTHTHTRPDHVARLSRVQPKGIITERRQTGSKNRTFSTAS